MAKDDFGWWRARLRHMAQYFHAFRIDHILGFFRIWEIPSHCVSGMMGRFYPSIPIWRYELESQGLWDVNRLTEPYVKTHLLKDQFGSDWEDVRNFFFQEISQGTFRFKDAFNTERKIAV
jgi:4-alpha-glucanotransferase